MARSQIPAGPYHDFVHSLADVWPQWCKPKEANALGIVRETINRIVRAKAWTLQQNPLVDVALLNALIWRIIPQDNFVHSFSHILFVLAARLLPNGEAAHLKVALHEAPEDQADIRDLMVSMMLALFSLGLPITMRARALATAADDLCSLWVQHNYSSYRPNDERILQSSSLLLLMERDVLEIFCPVVEVLHNLAILPQHAPHSTKSQRPPSKLGNLVQSRSRNQWQQTARLRLGTIRFQQIYEILHTEDVQIKNQLLADVLEVLQDPTGRAAADQGLQKSFRKHLLHAGSATVAILDEYMLLIETLIRPLASGKLVDGSGVLLDRAGQSIRSYLSQRVDAARIVINSLLNPEPGENGRPPKSRPDFSGRIAMAMSYHDNPHMAIKPWEGQDLLDPKWCPQPIDALSSHRATTSRDPIGHITSIQRDETFIEEFEQMLGERLLRSDQSHFHVEQRLLAMFRARFDDDTGDKTKIQPSDVMLSDMLQSLKWNELIVHPENLAPVIAASDRLEDEMETTLNVPEHEALRMLEGSHRTKVFEEQSRRESALLSSFRTENRLRSGLDFQARILSHAYWHSLKEGSFRVPKVIEPYLQSYAGEFERLSESRRLQWFPELGHVAVELELTDRTIREDVTPPQAAVIYAFADNGDTSSDRGATRSVQQLTGTLDMEEALVRDCVAFWSLKMVIRETAAGSDSFMVLERLDTDQAQSQSTTTALTQMDALESSHQMTQRDRLAEHADTYSAYIHGMLTNMGPMTCDRIAETLESMAPGGFPFDYSDLISLLDTLVDKGVVECAGAVWKLQSSALSSS